LDRNQAFYPIFGGSAEPVNGLARYDTAMGRERG
jgi:hypothetical protein